MELNTPTTQAADSSPDQNTTTPAPPTSVPVASATDPAIRFRGLGTNFRAKLIGVDDVTDSRGDEMCQESILKLKAAVQASGRHKQKVIMNVSLEGIKIVDVLTGEVQHVHPVHRISFIARDLTDRRAFGYVYGAGEGRHQFFGIKTAKVAELLVLALRDLFQVVYDMKKKEIEEAKEENVANGGEGQQAPVPTPRQQVAQGETVYAVPQKNQQEGNLFDLEQQLTTIQEGINNIDAIGPWPQDLPTSPDSNAGDLSNGGDLFGIANLSDISSLSSDFSCASNVVIDYGHAGGGQQQFERTGSSRSSVSCQGLEQSLALSRSSSHRAAGHSRLSSVPDESLHAKPVQQKKPEVEETRQTVTKDTAVINRTVSTNTPSKVKVENKLSLDTKFEKNGALSATAGEFSTESLRKTSSVQSLPGSEKRSKRHGPGFFSRSKKSSKKSKIKKEKASEKKKHCGDKHEHSRTASEGVKPEGVIKQRSVSTTLSDLRRRDSLSSVNSVRSCIVPTTVHNTESVQKSSSRTSLNVVSSSSISENQDEATSRSRTADSFIVRSSICPRTRPRPKNHEKNEKHISTKTKEDEQNFSDKNDIADDSVHSVDKSLKEDEKLLNSGSKSWIASFDSEFEHMSGSKTTETKNSDPIDPFTGLSTDELKSNLSATFDDELWGPSNGAENKQNPVASPQPFEPVQDFDGDPFSSETPFENVDPFASAEIGDPFAETLETFKDPFANGQVISKEFFDTPDNQKQESMEESEQLPDIPTFPPKSEEIMFTLKEQISHSAEESSMTSGMSTPMGTQSPEHTGNAGTIVSSNHISEAPPLPPAIPPRLPPRPKKKSPLIQEWTTSECPSVPPPPLPDILPDLPLGDELEDILNEDYDEEFSPGLCPDLDSSPPEIPQRSSVSAQNSIENQENNKGDTQSNLSSNGPPQQTSSYSDELFDLASPVAQPAPQPGAKLTKEQILSSFGTGAQQPGMFPGQPGMMMPPQAGMMQQGGMQYNAGFQQQMQGFPQAAAPMGMFPPGPSPAIPPRPGAMRPPTNQPLPGGAAQNPFGDSLAAGAPDILAPVNNSSVQKAESATQGRSDPFASLVPGMGAPAAASKKDMFKNFQMAKPPQPPPRTNPPLNNANDTPVPPQPQPSANFNDYFRNSVGGVLLTEDLANNNPMPAPRKQPDAANDPFGMGTLQGSQPAVGDAFGGNQDFSQALSQGTNNTQSLFG